ncbi:hypothetical protein [Streptomyces sp. NPDC004270]
MNARRNREAIWAEDAEHFSGNRDAARPGDLPPDGFALWPVAEIESFSYLPVSGELASAEVGTAVMRIVGCNDIDPDKHHLPTRLLQWAGGLA